MLQRVRPADLCLIVVDDDEEDLLFTLRCLKRLRPQAEVETYSDGEGALERLQRVDERGTSTADLVLIDQKMPGMSGAEVLRELKQSGITEKVPIVLFSSAVPPSEVAQALDAGAKAYVAKPVDPELYQLAIEEILRLHLKDSDPLPA